MKWFRKHTEKQKDHALKDAIAQKIATGIIRLQTALAVCLQKADAKLSLRQKKIALLLFCLLFGLYCCWLLGKALFGNTQEVSIYQQHIPPVAQPPPYSDTDSTTQYPLNSYQNDSTKKHLNRK